MANHKHKRGLRVKYGEAVAACNRKGELTHYTAAGWFVWAWNKSKWQAIADLPFRREQDAKIALISLTRAGLDTSKRLLAAPLLEVKRVACEDLQW